MNDTTWIYVLRDTADRIRYVGKTINPIGRRGDHRRTYPRWTFDLVQEVPRGQGVRAERELIRALRLRGVALENRNGGGCGGHHYVFTDEDRKKIGQGVRRAVRNMDEMERRIKLGSGRRGKPPWNKGRTDVYSSATLCKMAMPKTLEHRQKISQAKKGGTPWNKGLRGVQTPWNKGLQGVQVPWNKGLRGIKGKKHTLEARAKMSAIRKAWWIERKENGLGEEVKKDGTRL